MFVARVAHMIKLTEECEIAPYVWVHPDEERRGGAGTVVRKDGQSGPDALERGGESPCREHQTSIKGLDWKAASVLPLNSVLESTSGLGLFRSIAANI